MEPNKKKGKKPNPRLGSTPLHELIMTIQWGGITELEAFLSQENKVRDVINSRNADGQFGLHLAVREGLSEVIELLINHGATVNSVDENGITPLHIAVKNGKHSVVSLLLQKGAKNLPDNNRQTPLHLACSNKDRLCIELFLEKEMNVNNINSQNNEGQTPLNLLLESCGFDIRKRNYGEDYWKTFIEKIMRENDIGMLRIMYGFNTKFDEKSKFITDNCWNYFINFACSENCIEALEYFKTELGDTDFIEKVNNANALCTASIRSSMKIITFLIDSGANLNQTRSSSETPLHLAVRLGNLDIVDDLLRNKANPNTPDSDGKIPIFYAESSEIVEILLMYGSSISS